MKELITPQHAHDAVSTYLTAEYGPPETMSEDLGLMVLQIDNLDCWDEWERCLEKRAGGVNVRLSVRETFDLMRDFIQLHNDVAPCEDYGRIIDDSRYDTVNESGAPVTDKWQPWLEALAKTKLHADPPAHA